MNGAVPPLTHYTFMAWCSVKRKAQGYLYHLPFITCKSNWCRSILVKYCDINLLLYSNIAKKN
jgi:hypothetical protein